MSGLARVWVVSVDLSEAWLARCQEVLDDGERGRAAAFGGQRDRQRFEVAHGALRILVGGQLAALPSALRWTPGRHGKPELEPPWSWMCTSLSHSGDLVAVACSDQRPVGVDVQHLTTAPDRAALAARFFPPDEAEHVAAGTDPADRADRFAQLWTRKEAVVKAAGGRLWPNLMIAVHGREVVSLAEPACSHRVAEVSAPAGFRAAVSLGGIAPFEVKLSTWP